MTQDEIIKRKILLTEQALEILVQEHKEKIENLRSQLASSEATGEPQCQS